MDWDLQDSKSNEHRWEEKGNQAGKELKQLQSAVKEEGSFCVEWYVMSESMCTTLIY